MQQLNNILACCAYWCKPAERRAFEAEEQLAINPKGFPREPRELSLLMG
jgi:hypothetical protein